MNRPLTMTKASKQGSRPCCTARACGGSGSGGVCVVVVAVVALLLGCCSVCGSCACWPLQGVGLGSASLLVRLLTLPVHPWRACGCQCATGLPWSGEVIYCRLAWSLAGLGCGLPWPRLGCR